MFNPLQQVYIDSLTKHIEEFKTKAVINVPYVISTDPQSDRGWIDEWNRIHCAIVDLRNEFFADYCEKIILAAKNPYYRGEPIMSDSRFDSVEEALRSLRPKSKMLEKVGA